MKIEKILFAVLLFLGLINSIYAKKIYLVKKDISINVSNDESFTKLIDFTTRFYEVILDREPDRTGLDYWVDGLSSNVLTGSDIAREFILSEEFKSKNYDDITYLEKLYRTFFDREPDDGGMKFWISKLENEELNRDQVLNEFVHSLEFEGICNDYGIKPFDDLREFVTRFYVDILDRMPELDGINYWAKVLKDKTKTGADVAKLFVLSDEFKNKNVSDSEYITRLYKAFFNREPDEAGFSNWLDMLDSGSSREDILDGFLNAEEFINLCDKFGIDAFSNNDQIETGIGYYLDSAVVGVDYTCGAKSGKTENDGKFIFEKGKDCSFELAGIPLKKVTKEDLSDGKKIVEDNVSVAQLLQSIDADGNLDNGIQITEEVEKAIKEALKNINDPKKVLEDEEIKEKVVAEVGAVVDGVSGELKTEDEVKEHLDKTATEVTKELLAGKTFYASGTDNGEAKVFKIIVNKNATEFEIYPINDTVDAEIEKIEIVGNKVYWMNKGRDGYLEITQKEDYILATDEKNNMRLYSSEADAKKYYETLVKETTITEDKIKEAFVGKTLYKAFKCDNSDEIKYDQITVTDKAFELVEADGNKENLPYTLKDDTFTITEQHDDGREEQETFKVIKIEDGKYVVIQELDDDDDEAETWAYTKEEASKHLSPIGESNCNGLNEFSTEWLNGRELYIVEYDDFGYEDIGVKWNMATMEFTDKTMSWTEYNTPDTGTYTVNYHINDDGELVIDEEHFGTYKIIENEEDYIKICHNNDCDVYVFFDKDKAIAFMNEKNDN